MSWLSLLPKDLGNIKKKLEASCKGSLLYWQSPSRKISESFRNGQIENVLFYSGQVLYDSTAKMARITQ